jgi:hypothetical protein
VSSTAYHEAKVFFRLANQPGQTIASVRADILPGPNTEPAEFLERMRTVRFFDRFVREGRIVPLCKFKREPKLKVPEQTEGESLYALVREILGGRRANA